MVVRRLGGILLLLAGVAELAVCQPAPVAAVHPVTDSYPGGLKVVDPYRWLEDGKSADTRQWVAAENARTTAVLDGLPMRDRILSFLKQQEASTSTEYGSFQTMGQQLFALRFDPTASTSKLVVFANPADMGSEHLIVDFNTMVAGKVFQENWYVVSPDGKLVGVALSTGGSEDASLYVFRVADGKQVFEVLPHVQFATAGGSMAWRADGKAFYYTRYPRGTERPVADANFYQQVFLHTLGTPTEGDTYVLGRELPRIGEIWMKASPDGSHVLVSVENGDGGEYEYFTIDPGGATRQLSRFEDRIVSATFGVDNSVWLLSRRNSPHGEYLHMNAQTQSLTDARVVIPASSATFTPNSSDDQRSLILVTEDRLYTIVIEGGPQTIRVYKLDGTREADLPTPPVASVSRLVPYGRSRMLFSVVTYTTPRQWYVTTNAVPVPLPFHGDRSIKLDDIEVERLFATSKDGTKVPMTVLHRKGLPMNGLNPTILYGYGGYGINLQPEFNPGNRLLFDAGGVYAIANLRGGGEYGEDWHRGGALLHKQNVFDDFAACAQLLIDRRYTSTPHLAAQGGSNGGLLMGAMITQHPGLFKAVLSDVGIYDMLRVELDPNGDFNTTEFGSTRVPAQLKALYAYSPYHHVVAGTAYPATLFVTGDNDHRVNPANSRKMTALLQARQGGKAPILLLTNANAGHGLSSNLNEAELEQADSLAFVYSQIGVQLK